MTEDADCTLAVFGGPPAFAEPLHVGRPNLGDRSRFVARVDEMLDRRWLSNDGPFVKAFERAIEAFVGVKHCVATCNATVALEIAARALELHGEVIMPSYTFVATAHALQWLDITPVFADIDPATHNIDARNIARLVTSNTSAILGVHVWGHPCDTTALAALADAHGLALLYDAAHAFGNSHDGRMIGGFGACEVFSFHATKFLHSFEGGAIVTNDDALASRARLMRNFGFAGVDQVVSVGINGKMTEVSAAMGLTSLEAVDALVATNRANYEAYRRSLSGLSGIHLIDYDPCERNNYQYVVVEVDPDVAALTRDELVEVLHAENVLARKYFWPGVHRMEPYRSHPLAASRPLVETERVAARVVVLPTGQATTEAALQTITRLIRCALCRAVDVRSRLRASGRVAVTPAPH